MTPRPVWHQGWYRFAHAVASPNFGPRPADTEIDLVVIHSISLPPGVYGGQQVQALFTNTLQTSEHPYFETLRDLKVSSHFYIRRGGELLQFVSCDDRAWHAGVSTHAGRSQCNDFSIGIELEGIEGDRFTQEQYESLTALLPMIAQQYPVQHVAGHEHIAPDRKKDPGKGFSWRFLQQSLGWPDRFFNACAQSLR
ncbi:MAG: 1,6-anhydro-N-acetylmuramyl-L-alanine amidase AmpD [Betaproteobacteria bacterium]|nr:1,6-anhydro-N-acetylmuramyl-L-alanine amidase AmpD [Betaproteobacteria bacterium]